MVRVLEGPRAGRGLCYERIKTALCQAVTALCQAVPYEG
jgi:hypothetical protein